MLKNTICSLAMLAANYYVTKRDYIEIFIPFIATLIKRNDYSEIDISKLCEDFKNEYGLDIPYHPMKTILLRAKKKGIISKFNSRLIPMDAELHKYEFTSEVKQHIRKQEKLIKEIVDYAQRRHKHIISTESAEGAFISFFKDHDLDILFASDTDSILPEVSPLKTDKFIIYSYIKHVNESEPEMFKYIVDTAIGHLMANSLLYKEEFSSFVSKLKNVCFYLDTNFILGLIGLAGEDKKIIHKEFLKTLVIEGAHIYIFRHTYEETLHIIDECINWIENPAYDPIVASPVLKKFKRMNYTKIDVMRFRNKIEQLLEDNHINSDDIVSVPDKTKDSEYPIDADRLYNLIVETYKKRNPFFDEYESELRIRRDIDSIASIYELRKGRSQMHLKDIGGVLLTTNSALALASRRFEIIKTKKTDTMPACVTDTFVGTILWLQSPAKILEINNKKIIAECFAALNPDAKLIKKFMTEVEKLKKEEKITENEYYLLRYDQIALDILNEKTLGDADNFDSILVDDILDELTSEIRNKEGKKYLDEKEDHNRTLKELNEKTKLIDEQTKLIDEQMKFNAEKDKKLALRAEQIASIISTVIMYLIFIVTISGIAATIAPDSLFKSLNFKFSIAIYSIICFFNIGYGLNIIDVRKRVKKFLENRLIKFFGTN